MFHWVQTRFAATGWPGVERYFDWNFYSQGTGENRQTSADLFIAKALEFFFDEPWSQVSPNLTEADQAWLLNEAATRLRALGRLTEALQPMRAGLQMSVQKRVWKGAAIIASNLSELEVTLGRLPDAVTDARHSITHADQSGDASLRMGFRTTAADALHQSGRRAEAGTLFAKAEAMWAKLYVDAPLMNSLSGFRYCDWLLAPAEQAAWQHLLDPQISN